MTISYRIDKTAATIIWCALIAFIILGYSYIFKRDMPLYTNFILGIEAGEVIMISYRPLYETMAKKQITTYKLEKFGFSRATYYSIRQGNSVSTNTINQLCKILQCGVSDIIEYIDDEEDENGK